eukprot:TRINITY_DN388_c0_g1_i4.p1 TRINITY_DN388_c0_g1~~TRINITY_DN388_c0_g1_i4.p1  ORF type:complete len:231 (+),score=39.22 TRINITY_DN388_c0_g1_i4:114-806(+)
MEKGKWFESSLRLREMRHFCRENMKKLRSPFSYNRLNALNDFVRRLKFMSDTEMTHFVQVQDDPHLNVARQLFPSVISPVPMLVPPSLLEKLRALELLQYLCLVHQASRRYVREINGIEVLLRQLEHQHAPIQTAALDAILSCLHDSKENQEVFHSRSGFFKVVKLLKQKQCPLEVRLKSTEFLYLFVAYFDEQVRGTNQTNDAVFTCCRNFLLEFNTSTIIHNYPHNVM